MNVQYDDLILKLCSLRADFEQDTLHLMNALAISPENNDPELLMGNGGGSRGNAGNGDIGGSGVNGNGDIPGRILLDLRKRPGDRRCREVARGGERALVPHMGYC